MTDPRIARWDERYTRGEELHGFLPSPPLPEAIVDLAPGRALDLACGGGRHALYLAERGWQVDAVDASAAGLALLRAEAERRGVAARITPHRADLESEPPGFTIPAAHYDLIVDVYFLHRPLLAHAARGLRPGGLLVAAIHCDLPGQPKAHAFTLAPGELRAQIAALGLTILHDRETAPHEGRHGRATAEIVARAPR